VILLRYGSKLLSSYVSSCRKKRQNMVHLSVLTTYMILITLCYNTNDVAT